MRIKISSLVATAALATTLTACVSTGDLTTTPAKRPTAPAASATTAGAPEEEAAGKEASIGDTLTLKGIEDGEQLAATLKKWADPAESKDEFTEPQDGMRWVAAQFELVNTGTAVYDDSPSNGAQVADTEGQRFTSTFGDITAGPSMASAVKLPKGEKALGWIVFEVPKTSKIASIQFTMNSGFADHTGQWAVK
ncbi:DUF4352 domain-containing protein [Streptomyces sp. NPDC058872]|uniref:DUF4352 domain-containing protein n=1 Tax=Streptomyces sp. NPDC058872 TaxID=3346661 RepID=UPI0036C858C8